MYKDLKTQKNSFFDAVGKQADIFKEVVDLQVNYLNEYSDLVLDQFEKIGSAKDVKDFSDAGTNFLNGLKEHNTKYFNASSKIATKAKEESTKAFENATKEVAKASKKTA